EQRAAAGRQGRARRQPLVERARGRRAQRHRAALAALAAPHLDHERAEAIAIEIRGVEPGQLADAQAAAVEDLEHGAVPPLERGDVAQVLRDRARRVVALDREVVAELGERDVPVHSARSYASADRGASLLRYSRYQRPSRRIASPSLPAWVTMP